MTKGITTCCGSGCSTTRKSMHKGTATCDSGCSGCITPRLLLQGAIAEAGAGAGLRVLGPKVEPRLACCACSGCCWGAGGGHGRGGRGESAPHGGCSQEQAWRNRWGGGGVDVVWVGGALMWCGQGGALMWCGQGGALLWCGQGGALLWCGQGGALVWCGQGGALVWCGQGGRWAPCRRDSSQAGVKGPGPGCGSVTQAQA